MGNLRNKSLHVENRELYKVRSKVVGMVEKGDIPSMALAVARDGEIIWEEAFGWANQSEKTKATPHTIYPIASLSKSLTATGVMVLAERNQLDIDDPVEKYISPMKLVVHEGLASDVTVRRVLNMTAGIPHGYETCEEHQKPLNLRRFVERYGMIAFSPGEMELYSNFSYAIPELIIENVSGKSFPEFATTEIFEPLGMTHTTVGVAQRLKEYNAVKYGSDGSSIPHNCFVPAAAGGIYSSALDLIRYGMFHLKNHLPCQKQLLSEETLDAMHPDKDKNLPSAMRAHAMALGWGSVSLDNGLDWVLSNGSIEGATSMLSLVPSTNLAVVCLTNSTSRSMVTDQIAIEITDALIPKFAEKVETFMKQFELANTFDSYKPVSKLIGSWEGKVKTKDAATPIRIVFYNNGKVDVRLNKQDEILLENAGVRNGELKGDFQGVLPNEKSFHDEHTISIHVKVKNNRMYGVATAQFTAEQGFLMLPSYICLNRK